MTPRIPEYNSLLLVGWSLVSDMLPPRDPNDDDDDEDEEDEENEEEEPAVIREPDE